MLVTSSWHLLRECYEETAPVEFRLKSVKRESGCVDILCNVCRKIMLLLFAQWRLLLLAGYHRRYTRLPGRHCWPSASQKLSQGKWQLIYLYNMLVLLHMMYYDFQQFEVRAFTWYFVLWSNTVLVWIKVTFYGKMTNVASDSIECVLRHCCL